MPDPILVFCEQRDGALKPAGLEALGEAGRLGARTVRPVVALLVGEALDGPAADLASRGASLVLLADDRRLGRYDAEAYTAVLAAAAVRLAPVAILMGATALGRDLAPKLAARLGAPLLQDCTEVALGEEGLVTAIRPVYGGRLRATVRAGTARNQVVTLRPNVFAAAAPGTGTAALVERLPMPPAEDRPGARVREVRATADGRPAGGRVELTEAAVVVSGGRGLKGPEAFALLEGLAAALGGAVGASRAAVDAGWQPHERQVGLTGKTVTPQLYIACGISGAVQHQAGMASARTIVAVNTNPDAPIFTLADYGVVGDLFAIVPLLTEAVKELKAAGR